MHFEENIQFVPIIIQACNQRENRFYFLTHLNLSALFRTHSRIPDNTGPTQPCPFKCHNPCNVCHRDEGQMDSPVSRLETV